jgi:hypothetical protein
MRRHDKYRDGFSPSSSEDLHALDVLNPDLQETTFTGNHKEAQVVVQGLRLLLAESRKAEVMGLQTSLPQSHRISSILDAVSFPVFEEVPAAIATD